MPAYILTYALLDPFFSGLAVGSAEILSFIVSGMGVQAMQSIPISKFLYSAIDRPKGLVANGTFYYDF